MRENATHLHVNSDATLALAFEAAFTIVLDTVLQAVLDAYIFQNIVHAVGVYINCFRLINFPRCFTSYYSYKS